MSDTAYLALADGSLWPGRPFGARGRRSGEVVFNTSMTGYQEILADPSYRRQIVVMTAPHIGNTGVNLEDDESERVWVAGFAVRRASLAPSSWRATGSLDGYLGERDIVGIGVASGVHILHRYRQDGEGDIAPVVRHTGLAFFLSAATTMVGFGSVALSSHRGASSLGLLLLLGVGACLVTSTMFLPAMLAVRKARRERREGRQK